MNKILMVTPERQGGHINYSVELLNAIAAQRRNVVELVCCADPQFQQPVEFHYHDVIANKRHRESYSNKLHFALSRHSYFLKRELNLFQWIKAQGDVGLVHFQDLAPWFAGRFFERLKSSKIRTAFTVHNVLPHSCFGFPKSWFQRWQSRTWHAADVLFVHTEKLKSQLGGLLNDGEDRISITPHGIWTPTDRVNQVTSTNSTRNSLLFFGHIRRNKNLESLLNFVDTHPSYQLTIAGEPEDSSYRQQIRMTLKKPNLRHVKFLDGYIAESQVAEIFQNCDTVVIPYRNFHSQSGVLFMAAAYGKPVVVSDTGALGETVRASDIGEVCQETNVPGLAKALEKLRIPNRYNKVLSNVAAFADQNSWATTARETLKGYEQCL